jgi:hypothetical protein
MPPNDSALFPLRFTGVHGAAGLDQQRDRFFEVPLKNIATQINLLMTAAQVIHVACGPHRAPARVRYSPFASEVLAPQQTTNWA